MALQQLRRSIISNDPVRADDTHIIINESTRLKRSDLTNFRSLHGRGDFYTLDTIYYQYVFRDLVYNNYLQQCDKNSVQHVKLIDKKDVIAYLTGRIDSCVSVVEDSSQAHGDAKHGDSSALSSKKHTPSLSSSQSQQDRDGDVNSKGKGSDGQSQPLDRSYNRLKTRDQRSIDSVLMVKDRDFSALRDKLSQHVSAAMKGKTNVPQQNQKPMVSNGSSNNAAKSFDPRGDRYTSNEDRFWRENLGADFKDFEIDMRGSFKAKAAATSSSSQQTSKSSAPSSLAPKPATIQNRADLASSGNISSSHRSRRDHHYSSQSLMKRPKLVDLNKRIPIIIIPAGMSSLIFPGNAKTFFQTGHYMSIEEMRQKELSLSQPTRITVKRIPGGNCSQTDYHIVHNPNQLTKEEWDNQVVAVVLTGQLWQFKQWPIYPGQPLEFFKKIQGFFFHFDDTPPKGDVNLWTVKKLAFQRDRRHNDGQVLSQFWNILDTFIAKKRLPLRY